MQRLPRLAPRVAAVVRYRVLHLVEPALVARIDQQLARVRGARIVVAHLAPRRAFVVGAEDAAKPLLVRDAGRIARALLDRDVYHVRVLSIDRDADAAEYAGGQSVRQTVGQLAPCHAGVRRLP